MCGLTAIFAYHPGAPPVEQDELLRIRERMKPRGPDGSGLWLSEDRRVGLAHRRLSIIDLSESGAQPMMDPETGNIIVYNGEIYNYQELRKELESKGYRFFSNSDTEVLLHLYHCKGEYMVHDLRGMYAFAIYTPGNSGGNSGDMYSESPLRSAYLLRVPGIQGKQAPENPGPKPQTANRKPSLFIARDPYGIKPLYIHDDGKTLRIASQVKALLAGGRISKEPEPAGHAGFFLWGHVPEPYTLYKGITSLTPGTYIEVPSHLEPRTSDLAPRTFCSIRDELANASNSVSETSPEDARIILRESLLDTVRAHLVADVPVGIFLSSGLDSTTLVALAAEVGADLRTVTLGFEEYRGTPDDEVPLAEEVAKQYGARHQTVWVPKKEFQNEYDTLLDSMDQPTIDGVNTYFVSMAAKRAGLKVALSGLGGDELFGGYPGFKQIPKSVRAFGWASHAPWLGKGLRYLASNLVPRTSNLSPKYAGMLEYGGTYGGAYLLRRGLYMPWELPQIMDADMARAGLRKLQTVNRLTETEEGIPVAHDKVSALESTWYMRNQLLRDADWASMAHSLEVRVPLVDLNLLRSVAPLSGRFGMEGKKAMASTPRHGLPKSIRNRPKSGFFVPISEWMLPAGRSKGQGSREWAMHIYESLKASN